MLIAKANATVKRRRKKGEAKDWEKGNGERKGEGNSKGKRVSGR